jgi:hypothetical protein
LSCQIYAPELRRIAQQLQGSLDLTMRVGIADALRRINPITVRPSLRDTSATWSSPSEG